MSAPLGNPFTLGATGVGTTTRYDRLALGATFRPSTTALGALSGFLHGPAGTMGDLTLLTDLLLRVDPFIAVIQGTHNTLQGQYVVPNTVQRDLAVPAKDAGQSRRCLVVVRVADSLEAGVASSAATDGAWVEVLSGALAASNPVLPALPANAVAAGELLVPSTASGLPVTLTKYAPRTTSRGGILPVVADGANLPGHDGAAPTHDGQFRWHPTLGEQVGVGGVWLPSTPQLPRFDIFQTVQQAFGGGPYLMPWDGIYAPQTTPGLTGAGSIWQNEWFYIDFTARRQQVKRAGLYAYECEVTTNDGSTNQYLKLIEGTVSGSATGALIAQHGGTAAFGMNRISGTVRLAAGAWITQTLYTAQSARQDAPNLGLRTHLVITRLSD